MRAEFSPPPLTANPLQLGFLIEWLWPALGQQMLMREDIRTYIDIELELGEEPGLAHPCSAGVPPLTAALLPRERGNAGTFPRALNRRGGFVTGRHE